MDSSMGQDCSLCVLAALGLSNEEITALADARAIQ
jgi:hypothetical protein